MRKVIKNTCESRGEVTREAIAARQVFNPEGAMVDAIDAVMWESQEDTVKAFKYQL